MKKLSKAVRDARAIVRRPFTEQEILVAEFDVVMDQMLVLTEQTARMFQAVPKTSEGEK